MEEKDKIAIIYLVCINIFALFIILSIISCINYIKNGMLFKKV